MNSTHGGRVHTELHFPASPDSERSAMGGKGASLHALSAQGVPVPAWFVVGTAVFAEVRRAVAADLDAALAAIEPSDAASIDAAAAAIATLFAEAPLPEGFAAKVDKAVAGLGAADLAVRSSAAAEDSARDSFAGQLESYLHVGPAQVIDRVRACWASAFGARVLTYMHARGIDPREQRLGVVVQAMVASERSGVLFTANPAGSIDEVVIVAGYGLGEGVVTDQVEVDSYVYDRLAETWQVDVAEKTRRIVRGTDGGTVTEAVPADLCVVEVLSEAQRTSLLAHALTIEARTGRFVDVEWALDASGALFVTQSRPITTIPAGELSVFDNSNVVESYPGHTLPLTVSYIRQGYETLFRDVLLRAGASSWRIAESDHVFKNLLGYLDGRVYYNLGNWHRMFALVPGTGAYLAVWEEMLGIEPSPKSESRLAGLTELPRMLWVYSWVLFYFVAMDVVMAAALRHVRRLHREFAELDVDALDAVGLARAYRRWTALGTRGWDITLLNDGYCFVWSAIARGLLRKHGLSDELFGRLFAGDSELESVQPVRRILELSERVRDNQALREVLAGDFDREAIDRVRGGRGFLRALDDYLDAFGDRCMEELKLESASFRDEPGRLVELVLSYADAGMTVEDTLSREQAIVAEAQAEFDRGLEGRGFAKVQIRVAMAFARRHVRYREASRLERARGFGRVRTLFRGMGRELVDSGVLAHVDDVFYLGVEEVLNYIGGTGLDADVQGLVERRRALHASYSDKHPPERVRLKGAVGKNVVPRRRPPAVAEGELGGTGCSTGVITAQARVIRDPKNAGDCSGQILVAEMTDPGWVFLMLRASGLVVEKGSLLSHTAIIGRELGIPTVVGVKGATTRIADGDWLRIDGGTGTVEIVAPPDADA
ncbi:MAG: hypothetical protein EP330_01865 [Deltaproteobacteria bacterium]|nr:MAG: hypothetical protein EP330_01865 [Deltaproteobacteria bacterium]